MSADAAMTLYVIIDRDGNPHYSSLDRGALEAMLRGETPRYAPEDWRLPAEQGPYRIVTK